MQRLCVQYTCFRWVVAFLLVIDVNILLCKTWFGNSACNLPRAIRFLMLITKKRCFSNTKPVFLPKLFPEWNCRYFLKRFVVAQLCERNLSGSRASLIPHCLTGTFILFHGNLTGIRRGYNIYHVTYLRFKHPPLKQKPHRLFFHVAGRRGGGLQGLPKTKCKIRLVLPFVY